MTNWLGLASLVGYVIWKELHEATWLKPDFGLLFKNWGESLCDRFER